MMITAQSAAQIAAEPSPRNSEQAADAEVAFTLTDLAQRVRAIIEQRPVVALLAAVGVGYVAARLVSRGRR
jgi:hypothetical protein